MALSLHADFWDYHFWHVLFVKKCCFLVKTHTCHFIQKGSSWTLFFSGMHFQECTCNPLESLTWSLIQHDLWLFLHLSYFAHRISTCSTEFPLRLFPHRGSARKPITFYKMPNMCSQTIKRIWTPGTCILYTQLGLESCSNSVHAFVVSNSSPRRGVWVHRGVGGCCFSMFFMFVVVSSTLIRMTGHFINIEVGHIRV